MAGGGYVVCDDATMSTCLGATQVVEEMIRDYGLRCEQIYPHFVFRAGLQQAVCHSDIGRRGGSELLDFLRF